MTYETHHLVLALTSGIALAYAISQLRERYDYRYRSTSTSRLEDSSSQITAPPPAGNSLSSAIGSTPLILLPSLTPYTRCSIYAKFEYLQPGGSPKDRVALSILNHLESTHQITPYSGDTIYEGTVGSTGISLATLCRARGYRAHIVMPSDQSMEKVNLLKMLGAKVTRVSPAPIVDELHFVNVARRMAEEHEEKARRGEDGLKGRGVFADQFENEANWSAHYRGTGPEVWTQMEGRVDAFVAGTGTGGTVSGVGMYLKERTEGRCRVAVADPTGSGAYNKVRNGVFWNECEREGSRRRDQVDSVVEGIGLVRSTRNFDVGWEKGVMDDAVKVSDQQARNMARWLVEKEGLFVGSSSAVNCVAALETALQLGPGHRIVTIVCDSGVRHLSKFWAQIGEVGGATEVSIDDVLEGRVIGPS